MMKDIRVMNEMDVAYVLAPQKMVEDLRAEVIHYNFENNDQALEICFLEGSLPSQADVFMPLDRGYRFLYDRYKRMKAEIQKIQSDLKLKCNHVNEMEKKIKQSKKVINRLTHEKNALEEQNKELTTKLRAMKTKVLQNKTDCQSEIYPLKDELSREQEEKEASLINIKELEKPVSDIEQKWAAKYKADVMMLQQQQTRLRELALISDKDKAKMEKKQKKAKKEEEKRLQKELKEKKKQEKREKRDREKEEKRRMK